MNFFADPLAVGFIWRIGLLLFAWIVFWLLGREGVSHDWWINLLQAFRIVPRPQEEDESAPIYTRTNTLVIGPQEKKPEAEIIDYTPVIDKSRTVLKVLGSLMILVTLFHGFVFYRRYDPYFLFGPRTSQIAGPGGQGELPPPIPGAGGAGVIVPGNVAPRPGGQPGNSGEPGNPGQPGSGGQPSGTSQPGGPMGMPGGAPPTNRSGLLPQTGGGGAIGGGVPAGGGAGVPPR